MKNNQQIKVFIINLERSKDRWLEISDHLDKYDIKYERIEAVEGKNIYNLSDHFDLEKFKLFNNHDLVAGEAGCALSHISIWNKIVSENLNHAVVLEDDVVVTKKFITFINEFKNTDKYDYLKLEYSKSLYPDELDVLSCQKKGEFETNEVAVAPYCCGGYLISNKGASNFLNSTKNMYYPIDLLPLYTFPYSKYGVLVPTVVIQEGGNTTMEDRDFFEATSFNKIRVILYKLASKALLRKLTVILRKVGVNFV